MRIIGFCGPKGSGKDTAAKCLFKHNIGERKMLFRHAPMAEGVKAIAEDFFGWDLAQMADMSFKETPIEYWPGGPVEPPRQFLMDTANWLRSRFGGAIHAARWAEHATHFDNARWAAHVSTDLRFPEELDVFSTYAGSTNFLPIYILRTEAEETLARLKASGDKMANDPSESYYEMLLDYCSTYGAVISNDGEIHDLHNQVNNAVKMKLGHWNYWPDVQDLEPMKLASFAPAPGLTSTYTDETNTEYK